MRFTRLFLILCCLTICFSCQDSSTDLPLFERVGADESGIRFSNDIENSPTFNIFNYRNFYNGGGVAIGDLNNDGLPEVFFTSNMGKNKLFLNKGNFQFEDISSAAGIEGTRGWSTGVVMVDINADGLLDIYVCNAGYVKGDDQQNELFINNGDLTFTEKALQYKLDESGYTTHAAFFDYDLDGDLDCYILNNSFMPVNTLNYSNKRELKAEDWPVRDFLKGGGDKLLRNNNGIFEDVTGEAGIYSSLIGFGLGITVGDVNEDHLPDLYVSNDFYERDYLYINQGDGTFSEEIKDWMERLSLASMGADMADINNDGFPEIFVTEMLPESDFRRKTTTMFEDYNIHYLKLKKDFFYQYMHNTLQLNNKDRSFSEIAWYSGVSASDWSWGALLFDADGDGYRDIYVCNGVLQDVTDQDFINFFANDVIQKMVMTGQKEEMEEVINKMPSNPIPNKLFLNKQDLTFKAFEKEAGIDIPSFSNGAAYGDLDNDGDLDLIVNNLNQEAFVFRNTSRDTNSPHYLKIQLKGQGANPFAVGAKVNLYHKNEVISGQLIPTRGFQSSVEYPFTFGLGEKDRIDSIKIVWPDQSSSVIPANQIPLDTLLVIDQAKVDVIAEKANSNPAIQNTLLTQQEFPFTPHKEDEHVDFFEEGLTFRMLSREGPQASIADVNNDGIQDFLMGSSRGDTMKLYLGEGDGFRLVDQSGFEAESGFEETALAFFDANGDGFIDVFVGSGGNFKPFGSRELQDRIYFNDGSGKFKLNPKSLPNNGFNTSVVLPFDLEGDGDTDLFVGSRSVPMNYGTIPLSYIYENNGEGVFRDVTDKVAPGLRKIGLVTDAVFTDLTGDQKNELVIAGEWMAPEIFQLEKGKFERTTSGLSEYSGWWSAVESADLDNDGDQDLVLGNRGENFYSTSPERSALKLWVADFDQNGTKEKILTEYFNGKDMPLSMKSELTNQIVSLKKKNLKHIDFAKKGISELFPAEKIQEAQVLEASYFKSAIAFNEGNGLFRVQALPREVQFSCVCAIHCEDLNNDGKPDLLLAGNDGGFLPQYSKLDASFGHTLINQGAGEFERMENKDSGFFVRGEVKQILPVMLNEHPHVLTTINRKKPHLFKLNIE